MKSINALKAPFVFGLAIIALLFTSLNCFGQYRPDLFFREDWKESPAEIPVTQEHLANETLKLTLYGPGAVEIKKSNHDVPIDDPFYVWSGLPQGNWAVTLKKTGKLVDLSEYSKVVWRAKQSGLRCLHLVLKLEDGSWLVSEQCDGKSLDWRIFQFNINDLNWYALNIDEVVEGRPIEDPDLSRVEEIGFTDLMKGGGTPASSRLDWIEVYGRSVD